MILDGEVGEATVESYTDESTFICRFVIWMKCASFSFLSHRVLAKMQTCHGNQQFPMRSCGGVRALRAVEKNALTTTLWLSAKSASGNQES